MHVRRAEPGDEGILRSLRLRALADAPDAFSSTYERERERSEADWRRWIIGSTTFLLEDGDGAAAGLVAAQLDHLDPALMWLLALWVDPSIRGKGGADSLVTEVLQLAAARDAKRVRLHVVEGNAPARKLYDRHGFVATGATLVNRKGALEIEMEVAP